MITILMPCLNEIDTLPLCIQKAKVYATKCVYPVQILISDNGSTDGSIEYAKEAGVDIISVRERGYGSALFSGCMSAKGKYIIIGDSDDSYDFSNLDPFIYKLENGYDLVMGNRFAGGIYPGAMPWKNKYIGNPILSGIGKILYTNSINDYHCGLRAFTKEAFLKMDLRTSGMEFASEMVIKATIFNLKITEVPTTLKKDGRKRPPHLRPWRDGWRHLKFLLLFSPNFLFLYPGIFIYTLSTFGMFYIYYFNNFNIFNIQFSNNSFIYLMCFSVIGFISISFSYLVKSIGVRDGIFPEFINKPPPFFKKMEYGVIISSLIIIFGLFKASNSVLLWNGDLLIPNLRNIIFNEVVLSSYFILIGFIGFIFSFIASFISVPKRKS